MSTCATCGGWKYNERHACPPLFGVRCDDNHGPDEWVEIRAVDPEQAAEKWAESEDQNGDYLIVAQRSKPTVDVRSTTGEVTRWQVSGEAVPQYYAQSVPLDSRSQKP